MERISNNFSETLKNVEESSEIKTFGLIVYNKTNPIIRELLNNDYYWDALHAQSGKRFTIFAVKPQNKMDTQNSPKGVMGMLRSIEDDSELFELFQIKSEKELPLFIIFTKFENKIDSFYTTKIDESSLDSARKELMRLCSHLNEVSMSLDAVTDAHALSANEKFKAIMQKHNFKKGISSVMGMFEFLRKSISFSSSTDKLLNT